MTLRLMNIDQDSLPVTLMQPGTDWGRGYRTPVTGAQEGRSCRCRACSPFGTTATRGGACLGRRTAGWGLPPTCPQAEDHLRTSWRSGGHRFRCRWVVDAVPPREDYWMGEGEPPQVPPDVLLRTVIRFVVPIPRH